MLDDTPDSGAERGGDMWWERDGVGRAGSPHEPSVAACREKHVHHGILGISSSWNLVVQIKTNKTLKLSCVPPKQDFWIFYTSTSPVWSFPHYTMWLSPQLCTGDSGESRRLDRPPAGFQLPIPHQEVAWEWTRLHKWEESSELKHGWERKHVNSVLSDIKGGVEGKQRGVHLAPGAALFTGTGSMSTFSSHCEYLRVWVLHFTTL